MYIVATIIEARFQSVAVKILPTIVHVHNLNFLDPLISA